MKKKKGFTLIEIIVTIAIIAIISTVIALNIHSLKEKQNEKDWDKIVNRIKTAAEVYLESNPTIKDNAYNGTIQYVSINSLLNAGLIDENYITDPRDGIKVTSKSDISYTKIKVYKNVTGALEVDYPSGSGLANHTLTINLNGGTSSNENSYSLVGNEAITLSNPTKTNYIFQGWRRSDNNELFNGVSFTMPNNNITLTAVWQSSNNVLTIVTSGGLWNGVTPQTIIPNTPITINTPTKTGYFFLGWRRSDNNELFNGTSFTMPENSVTLTAEWTFESTSFAYIASDAEKSNPHYEWTVPKNGWYQIEAWGASGGKGTYAGGKGGYTTGIIELEANDKLYIYVGGKGIDNCTTTYCDGGYNGGGGGVSTSASIYQGSGGGATDIRFDHNTLNDRIMVAAGGGGGSQNGSSWYGPGGAGGNIVGISAVCSGSCATTYPGLGGKQNAGGVGGNCVDGSFGTGGTRTNAAAGGGGGYYGGGCGWGAGGGGGSSFISGYAGVNALNSDGTHSDNTRHYSEKIFIISNMQSGANEGNGKAKITYLGSTEPIRINTKLTNVRYIKSCATESTCGTACYMHWSEFQALKDGVNLAKGLAVEGTFNTSNQSSTVITDGIIGDAYHAGSLATTGDRCIIVDLGDRYNLDELAVWHYWGGNWIYKNNTMWVSSDKTNWTSVMSILSEVETSNGKRVSAYSMYYDYTGAYQEFTVPVTGNYQIELWGAQGGNANTTYKGGNGGYTSGKIQLEANEKLYIYVGGKGIDGCTTTTCAGGYNGGGSGGYYTSGGIYMGSGGGATDIRYEAHTLNDRIMIAGGGGGGTQHSSYWYGPGGAGGNLHGSDAVCSGSSCSAIHPGLGGTQSSGGLGKNCGNGGFGFGGTRTNAVAGGGGGYYGGGCGWGAGGGGGSSFISGHTGCVAIASASDDFDPRIPKSEANGATCAENTTDNSCSIHYSGKYFSDTMMINGVGQNWTGGPQQMPNPQGGYYAAGTGRVGNGYAKITYLGAS